MKKDIKFKNKIEEEFYKVYGKPPAFHELEQFQKNRNKFLISDLQEKARSIELDVVFNKSFKKWAKKNDDDLEIQEEDLD
jgi:hypothetical protein